MSRSLVRVLGVGFGLAVTIGNTVAAGILRTPGDVATSFPEPLLFVGIWVVGAAYAFLGANAVAELGTMLPRSGAQLIFARHTFGDYVGFVVGWNDWISTCATVTAISIVFGDAAASFLGQGAAGGSRLATGVTAVAIAVVTLVLSRGTRVGGRVQAVTSLLKALVLVSLVVACFAFAGRAVAPPASPAAGQMPFLLALVLAAQAVIYTYDGWTGPIYFSEELKDPARDIPRAMFGGLVSVAALYVLINVAFMTAVPPASIAGSPLAAATVAGALFGAAGDLVVRAVVVAALPSAIIANLLMASRVMYALGRTGLGPRTAAGVNEGGTPIVSLLLSTAMALSLLTLGVVANRAFQLAIAIAAFFFVANYSVSFVALFVLRRREPTAPRPWRAKGHPWTTGVVLVGSFAFLAGAVIQDTTNSLWALGLLVASYPVFALVQRGRRRAVGVPGD